MVQVVTGGSTGTGRGDDGPRRGRHRAAEPAPVAVRTPVVPVLPGPYPTVAAALSACAAGPTDACAKRLDDGAVSEGGVVACG